MSTFIVVEPHIATDNIWFLEWSHETCTRVVRMVVTPHDDGPTWSVTLGVTAPSIWQHSIT